MFIRWQLYRSKALNPQQRQRNDESARLKAILVESVRIDGKPRTKHIAFLGSTSIDGRDRLGFWYEVTTSLDRLSNPVSPPDRKQIVAAIAKRLGERPPTKAQIRAFGRRREQLMSAVRTGDDGEDIEAEIDDEPDTRRLAFILRADQARLFAKYTGPIDGDVMEAAHAASTAWVALLEELETREKAQ